MVLMSFDELQDQPNYQNYVVNPNRNQNYEKAPLNSTLQTQTQQDEECDGDEPGEEGPLDEAHDGF